METLSLSTRSAGLIAEVDMLDAGRVAELCKYFIQSVVAGSSKTVVEDKEEPTLRAISTLLLEAAKVRANPTVVANILQENGVTTNAKSIVSFYTQHQNTLITHIETTGIAAPSIVGLDWRLDYSVRSKHGGRENVPMFFVTLFVVDRGVKRDIDMIASQEELKDLLSRVKEAVRSVGKVVTTVGKEEDD